MSEDRDWIAEEIEAVTARRDKLMLARAANPQLDPSSVDVLAILDRQLAELQETAA